MKLVALSVVFVAILNFMIRVGRAAILAGGKSSRMGRDKALIPFGGAPLIRHIAQTLAPLFSEVVVVTADARIEAAAQLPAIADQFPNRGALGGIHAALAYYEAPTFVVACDMPHLNADFIRFLCADWDWDCGARVPLSPDGFEPLHAVYAPSCVPTFENYLRNEGKMPPLRRVLEEVGATFIAPEIARGFDQEWKMFANWNAPADVARGENDGAEISLRPEK